MSALVVAHPGRAVAYGAEELKRAAHKFGFFALLISVALHFSVIGSYYLSIMLDGEKTVPFGPVPGPIIVYDPGPKVPGIPRLPTPPGPAVPYPRGKDGVPVPVVDPPDITETIPTQEDRGRSVDPNGNYPGPGTGVEEPISIPDDMPPPIFQAVEKDPVIVKRVVPAYPPLALLAGLEGKVFVKIWVDRQGKVRQVEVLKSDYDIFNEAAIEAARQFVFTPAYMNNGPVSVWVAVPFTFKIASK